ncbi:hypothetical protein [Sphingosinithalassobacter sp. CS137]|uniref:hypothetical protein n=1 Tax=Sphingosinithalassobacter sp. CS137 TaxID=2762748 RepID=UPI00165DC092|nr:hypothetical protein [Sphingosinithalassobacter sp. CS137]
MLRPPLLYALAAVALLSGCAPRAAAPEPAAALPPTPPAPPQPPPGGMADQPPLPTPNRGLSPAATLWHLRAGLNVAALQCTQADGIVPAYNRLLSVHSRALARAHEAVVDEHANQLAYDRAMTGLYNYFAQPTGRDGFCGTAEEIAVAAAATDTAALPGFAATALADLDRSFTAYHAAWTDYRARLVAWRASGSGIPRIAYDPAVFLASDTVIAPAE